MYSNGKHMLKSKRAEKVAVKKVKVKQVTE